MELTIKDGVLQKCAGDEEHVRIPEGVTTVASRAFYDLKVQSVELPESLEVIETNAFYYCYRLTDVVIPHAREIRHNAFNICPRLKRLTLPDGMESFSEFIIAYVPNDLVIRGRRGSQAQAYARVHRLVFIDAETGREADDSDVVITENPETSMLENCYLRRVHHFYCSAASDNGIDANDYDYYFYRIPAQRKLTDGDRIIGISYKGHSFLLNEPASLRLVIQLEKGYVGGWGDVDETDTYDLIPGPALAPEKRFSPLPPEPEAKPLG